jgi:RNA 3'-terminal phosphate cyclase (GTP)
MIQLDGSVGEGGGQILRTALALSVLLQKPFTITNIRKNRPEPGLKNQHLYCIKALQQLYNTDVEGAFVGSESLKFIPGKQTSQNIKIDIETAGSITLVLQSLFLPCLFTETIRNSKGISGVQKNSENFSRKTKKIEIIGGTDVSWSPQIDYFKEIILPIYSKYAEKIELNIEKRGYYPKGNGKITLKIKPKYTLETINQSKPLNLIEQGKLLQIKGISHASRDLQSAEVAERQSKAAKQALAVLGVPINIQSSYSETLSTGSGITLWAIFSDEKTEIGYKDQIRLGSDILGEKGKPAEVVGKEAALNLLGEIKEKAPVDRYLADNLIPLLALTKGEIKISKITEHTKTNIYTVEQFLGKIFKIEGNIIETLA